MRNYNFELLTEIMNRWSPRAFSNQAIEEANLWQMIDAARFAPSCFNEQPYRYVIFHSEDEVAMAKSYLKQGNVDWNQNVPAYIGILYHKYFDRNGKDNKWAAFDTGTSWGLMSLEAVRLGLVTHAMAGFDRVKLREAMGISDDFDFIALVAVGHYGKRDDLSPERQANEKPNTRHPIEYFVLNRDVFK